MHTTIVCAIVSALCSTAQGHNQPHPDVMQRIDAYHSAQLMRPAEAFSGNPASMATFRDASMSHIAVTGRYLDRNKAYREQEGTGHLIGEIKASSYMHLSPSTTVWGDASFTTGTYRNILWNNSADYTLVGPYVLGDSVGGDLSNRSYRFSGGYAGTAGEWGWGAMASYTASIDYRNRDPRDKIIVSDLSIEAGATCAIADGYNIGIGSALRIYNQESDVEFYNPNNDIRAYAMTGLGNYYARFSGTSNLNTAYKGIGVNATAQFYPKSDNGMFANIRFSYIGISQVLRDFNNLELTYANHYNVALFTAYTFRPAANLSLAPAFKGFFNRRIGSENIFGSSVGNNYLKLGKKRNYYADNLSGTISITTETMLSNALTLLIEPSVCASYASESYRSPHRKLGAMVYLPKLEAGVRWHITDSKLLSVSMAYAYRMAHSTVENLADINLDSAIAKPVLHNFAMLTSDGTHLGLNAEYCTLLDAKLALFIKAYGMHQWLGHNYHAMATTICLGLKF